MDPFIIWILLRELSPIPEDPGINYCEVRPMPEFCKPVGPPPVRHRRDY
jgi:hypothetical protein